jgi:hypothetical protein
MRITNAFLANHAETRDGLAFVSGAFPEWWTVPSVPAVSNLAMVFVCELEESDLDQSFPLDLVVVRPDGGRDQLVQLVTTRRADGDAAPGTPRFQVAALLFSVQFQEAGLHRFEIVGETATASVPLLVRIG